MAPAQNVNIEYLLPRAGCSVNLLSRCCGGTRNENSFFIIVEVSGLFIFR